ncbi:MAG: 5-oxoprolinase subunit PxpB [Vicinamibacterales bacterium]
MAPYQISPCGDSMLLVEFEASIDPVVNDRVIALGAKLRNRRARGILDVVPGYRALGVHFDPLQTDLAALERAISADAASIEAAPTPPARPIVEIPVQYGGEMGPDLDAVASQAACSPAEVIERHSRRIYRVYMLGFVPGFAYMGRVDPSISVPRHRVPRERVAAGSVGIAGEQTGVYPIESPGGWHLIGRTPTRMFDSLASPPSLLQPGDLVRFVRDATVAE